MNSRGSALDQSNKILVACWHFKGKEYRKWGGEHEQQELLKAIEEADFIVAHNTKFELQWLRRIGADLRDILVWDTMLAEWVIGGNRWQLGQLGLEDCCRRHGMAELKDDVGHWIRKGVDTESIPKQWLTFYCHQDVNLCRELFNRQVVKVRDSGQLHLVYQRGLVCACLSDIEFNGMKLDPLRVDEEYLKVSLEHKEVSKKLEAFGDTNWRSPKQVAALLYDTLGFDELKDWKGKPRRTESGGRKTDAETLSKLKATNAKQRQFVDLYKKAASLNAKLSKSLDFFKGICERYGGVFYGQFNQGSVQTHRLSASGRKVTLANAEGELEEKGAQFQNLPREYKRLFTTKRRGWLLLDADGSQLEFRVAAELGADDVAREEIRAGADIHSITAERLSAAGEPTNRQDAKSRSFRPLYGGTSGTPAEQAYCQFFQAKYKGIFNTQTGWTYEVLKTGQLVTPYGLIFYWPDTKMRRSGFIDNTTSIFNFPVQGFATGEIIPIALVWFWHLTKGLQLELVNTIHDSIIAEVHPDDADEAKEIAFDCLTTKVYRTLKDLYGYEFSKVPLGAEVKLGTHWGEGKGEKR